MPRIVEVTEEILSDSRFHHSRCYCNAKMKIIDIAVKMALENDISPDLSKIFFDARIKRDYFSKKTTYFIKLFFRHCPGIWTVSNFKLLCEDEIQPFALKVNGLPGRIYAKKN